MMRWKHLIASFSAAMALSVDVCAQQSNQPSFRADQLPMQNPSSLDSFVDMGKGRRSPIEQMSPKKIDPGGHGVSDEMSNPRAALENNDLLKRLRLGFDIKVEELSPLDQKKFSIPRVLLDGDGSFGDFLNFYKPLMGASEIGDIKKLCPNCMGSSDFPPMDRSVVIQPPKGNVSAFPGEGSFSTSNVNDVLYSNVQTLVKRIYENSKLTGERFIIENPYRMRSIWGNPTISVLVVLPSEATRAVVGQWDRFELDFGFKQGEVQASGATDAGRMFAFVSDYRYAKRAALFSDMPQLGLDFHPLPGNERNMVEQNVANLFSRFAAP